MGNTKAAFFITLLALMLVCHVYGETVVTSLANSTTKAAVLKSGMYSDTIFKIGPLLNMELVGSGDLNYIYT